MKKLLLTLLFLPLMAFAWQPTKPVTVMVGNTPGAGNEIAWHAETDIWHNDLINDEYGQYFKVARLFARIIGRPALMRELSRVGMQSRTLMEWVLRIMANLLRPDEVGPAEAAYKAAAAIVRLAPNA